MKTQSGEVFVARYDEDSSKWVGYSGRPIQGHDVQHYLEWAACNMCSTRADTVLVECCDGGVVLRVKDNQSQVLPLLVAAFVAAETGMAAEIGDAQPESQSQSKQVDTTTRAYKDVSDWLATNFRYVLWAAWKSGQKFHAHNTSDSAQEVSRWILEHANDLDTSRGTVEAFCRAMLRLRLTEISLKYVRSWAPKGQSQLEGEISARYGSTGELDAALPPTLTVQQRWVLTNYAKGYTLEELGKLCSPPICKVAVYNRLKKAIAAVQEHYSAVEDAEVGGAI